MLEWMAYYADGQELSNQDNTPANLPGWGVLVIVQADDRVGRVTLHSHDFYLYITDTGWIGVDWFGLIDWLVNDTGRNVEAVKTGRMVDNPTFDRAMVAAATVKGFPRKSGRRQSESPHRL